MPRGRGRGRVGGRGRGRGRGRGCLGAGVLHPSMDQPDPKVGIQSEVEEIPSQQPPLLPQQPAGDVLVQLLAGFQQIQQAQQQMQQAINFLMQGAQTPQAGTIPIQPPVEPAVAPVLSTQPVHDELLAPPADSPVLSAEHANSPVPPVEQSQLKKASRLSSHVPKFSLVAEFLKLKPPKYEGDIEEDPYKFLIGLDDIFTVMRCSDDDRVGLAAFRLAGHAKFWWLDHPKKDCTWDEFKDALMERMVPETVRDQKIDEFYNFRQEHGMTVSQYEQKFMELGRYARQSYSTEQLRAKKFLKGLLPRLSRTIAPMNLTTVRAMVDAARSMEMVDTYQPKESTGKRVRSEGFRSGGQQIYGQSQRDQRHRFQFRGSSQNRFSQPFQSASVAQAGRGAAQPSVFSSGGAGRGIVAPCRLCGSRHAGSCDRYNNNCFFCHQPGHRIADCPINPASRRSGPGITFGTRGRAPGAQGSIGTGGTGSGQARVYAVTREEAQASGAAVTGAKLEVCAKLEYFGVTFGN